MRYLPPDISYGIECAAECFDITADIPTFFYNFNDANIVDRIDALDNREFTWDACHRRYANTYRDIFQEWFDDRSTEAQRIWCMRGSAEDFSAKVGEKWEYLYSHYVAQSINSGHTVENRANMRFYLRTDERFQHTQDNIAGMVNRINSVPHADLMNAFVNPEAAYIAADIEIIATQVMEQVMDQILTVDGRLDFTGRKNKRQLIANIRKGTKARQKVLKKSSSFLSRLIGKEDATAFIRGDAIDVMGQRYTFRLKKKNIVTVGHGGFQISVIDQKTDNRLVDLCWYLPETPALDQLAALVMHVKVGDEEEILRVANHLSITQEARTHEEFVKFLPEKLSFSESFEDLINDAMIQMETVTERAFLNEDRFLHLSPGTSQYITYHADTFRAFVEVANELTVSIRDLHPDIAHRYRLKPFNEIRVIEGSTVLRERYVERSTERLLLTDANLYGNQIYQVMNRPGAIDRIVEQTVENMYADGEEVYVD